MTSGPAMAKKDYVQMRKPSKKMVPSSESESNDEKTIILYDHPIRTDRTMPAQNVETGLVNRPDIIVRCEKTTLLNDVSVSLDTNIV